MPAQVSRTGWSDNTNGLWRLLGRLQKHLSGKPQPGLTGALSMKGYLNFRVTGSGPTLSVGVEHLKLETIRDAARTVWEFFYCC